MWSQNRVHISFLRNYAPLIGSKRQSSSASLHTVGGVCSKDFNPLINNSHPLTLSACGENYPESEMHLDCLYYLVLPKHCWRLGEEKSTKMGHGFTVECSGDITSVFFSMLFLMQSNGPGPKMQWTALKSQHRQAMCYVAPYTCGTAGSRAKALFMQTVRALHCRPPDLLPLGIGVEEWLSSTVIMW